MMGAGFGLRYIGNVACLPIRLDPRQRPLYHELPKRSKPSVVNTEHGSQPRPGCQPTRRHATLPSVYPPSFR